jgi:methylenetetrahydrofolate dehydrogenase (NADP+)/methenyltetrahydrofolate cyclohydrolase
MGPPKRENKEQAVGKILYGKDVAQTMAPALRREAEALRQEGVTPTLAIVRVGGREDDVAYERAAMKRCENVGIQVRQFVLDANITEEALLDTIGKIGADAGIHGCLLFRPLPKGIDENRVCNALPPEKDVDGVTETALSSIFAGMGQGYPPCTARACIELLGHYGYDLLGKKVVVVGRSLVIGKPVSMMALAKNATVTICHSKTPDLASECRSADILIVAAGKAGLVDETCLSPGTVVIDVGIHVDGKGNLRGDVRKEALGVAGAYAPVPGGVGAVTTSVLAGHVLEAARNTLQKA